MVTRPVGDLDDAADDAVHEVAVVAGHQQRPLELVGEPLLEPDDRLDVEVVGRLVEEQHVGVEGEDAGEGDAHLPAAAEALGGAVVGVGADAEAGENRLGAGFQVVAAAVLELLLGVAVALEERGELLVPHRLAHLRLHGADLLAELDGAGAGGHHLLQGRAAGHLADVLGEVADDRLLGAADLAGVGLLLAGDQAEDGGLAGAVGADQAAAGAGEDLEARVLEQDLGAVLLADAGQMDHGESPKEKVPHCYHGRGREGKGILQPAAPPAAP